MKICIAYGTKTGTARKCAEKLSAQVRKESALVDLQQENGFDIGPFDLIIIGGPVRMGKIHPAVKRFCDLNLGALLQKKTALFICGIIEKDRFLEEFSQAFPKRLIEHSFASGFFGGEILFSKLNWVEKPLIKKVLKTDQDLSNILDDEVSLFASKINQVTG